MNRILGIPRKKYEYKKDRINSYMIHHILLDVARTRKKLRIHQIAKTLGYSESYTFRVFSGQCGIKTDKLRMLCDMLDLEFSKIVKGKVVSYE